MIPASLIVASQASTATAAATSAAAAASSAAGMAAFVTNAPRGGGGGGGGGSLTSCRATTAGSGEDAPANKFSAPRNLATALGPSVLVGSTAAFFASTLGSSSLSPMSGLLMGLLAVQYSLQPRVSKACLDRRINKRSVAMVEEFFKIGIAAAFLARSGRTKLLDALQGWTLSSSLVVAGIPAAIYAVQGVLYVFSYQNLDSVTFNGLAQTKTLSAALCCFLLLGQRQSPVQVCALVALACSALVFQGQFGKMFGRVGGGGSGNAVERGGADSSSKGGSGGTATTRFALGIVPCLAASFLSGLAGALSQKGLQITGGTGRNAYLYTVEVSGFSAMCLILSMMSGRSRRGKEKGKTASGEKDGNSGQRFFEHWSLATFYPIMLKAAGGVLTALVHKHAGTVAKGFAVICGLVLSGVFQNLLDEEHLSLEQFVGIALVNLSSWLHFTNPPLF